MRIIIWIIIIFALLKALDVQPGIASAPLLECLTDSKECLIERAKWYADVYNIDEEKYLKTIQGESSWNPKVVGDAGKAYSLAQFHIGTFEWMKNECGLSGYDYYDPTDQLAVMACAFSKGYQNHWTAYRALK